MIRKNITNQNWSLVSERPRCLSDLSKIGDKGVAPRGQTTRFTMSPKTQWVKGWEFRKLAIQFFSHRRKSRTGQKYTFLTISRVLNGIPILLHISMNLFLVLAFSLLPVCLFSSPWGSPFSFVRLLIMVISSTVDKWKAGEYHSFGSSLPCSVDHFSPAEL